MWDFGLEYYEKHLTAPQQAITRRNGFLEKLPVPAERNNGIAEMFYKNFEIIDVARFLQPHIMGFNVAVDATNNVYHHR